MSTNFSNQQSAHFIHNNERELLNPGPPKWYRKPDKLYFSQIFKLGSKYKKKKKKKKEKFWPINFGHNKWSFRKEKKREREADLKILALTSPIIVIHRLLCAYDSMLHNKKKNCPFFGSVEQQQQQQKL